METREEKRQRDRDYYWRNRELISIKKRNRISRGLIKVSEKEKRSKVVRNQKRRAILKNLPNSYTFDQWQYCQNYFDNKCCYCGADAPLQQEHFIPISKMGAFTADNILPSCGACNVKKGNKDFFKWYPKEPFYSKEREIKILQYLKSMSVNEQKSS